MILRTIAESLGASFWPEPVRGQLLDMQYSARRDSVRTNFPDGESLVILFNGQNAGWQYVAKLPDCIHLVEIMIATEFRGKGVGSARNQAVVGCIPTIRKAGEAGRERRQHRAPSGCMSVWDSGDGRRQIQLTMEYTPS